MRLRPVCRPIVSLLIVLFLSLAFALPASAEPPKTVVTTYPGYISTAAAWTVAPAGTPCVAEDAVVWTVKNCSGQRMGGSFYSEVWEDVTESVHTLVIELTFERSAPQNELQLDLLSPDVPRGSNGAVLDMEHPGYSKTEGDTYLRLRVDQEHWVEHGYAGIGTWTVRVFGGDSLGTGEEHGVGAGLTIDQPFDLYVSVFHNAPAPDEYTAVPEEE